MRLKTVYSWVGVGPSLDWPLPVASQGMPVFSALAGSLGGSEPLGYTRSNLRPNLWNMFRFGSTASATHCLPGDGAVPLKFGG